MYISIGLLLLDPFFHFFQLLLVFQHGFECHPIVVKIGFVLGLVGFYLYDFIFFPGFVLVHKRL